MKNNSRNKFEAFFSDSGTFLKGLVVQNFKIPGQNRRVVLLDNCEPSGPDIFAYLYKGDSILDIGALTAYYKRAYETIASRQGLPASKNLFHLGTFREHFGNHPEFEKRFWSLIEKVYEIREFDSLPEQDRESRFVNGGVNGNVDYYALSKHPAELEVLTGKGIESALKRYNSAIKQGEKYSGLIFSDMDRRKGALGEVNGIVADFFWRAWNEHGYSGKKIFLADPEELALVAETILKTKEH